MVRQLENTKFVLWGFRPDIQKHAPTKISHNTSTVAKFTKGLSQKLAAVKKQYWIPACHPYLSGVGLTEIISTGSLHTQTIVLSAHVTAIAKTGD